MMTLDEWKSMEEGKRVKAEFNIRKAGEGCSGDPQWKKMFVLSKKEKPEVHDEDEDQQVVLPLCCVAGGVHSTLLHSALGTVVKIVSIISAFSTYFI